MSAVINVTLFPKIGDFRFHLETPDLDKLYATYSFDAASLQDSRLQWQQANDYAQKKLLTDNCTVMVQTQANTSGAAPYPLLEVLDVNFNSIHNLNTSPYVFGAQQIVGNSFTDPITGVFTALNSYLYQFLFSQFLAPPNDSGIFYLRFTNVAANGTTKLIHLSEPIFVYGQDAADTFPNTILIEAKNFTNRASQATIATGWTGSIIPVFRHRVFGHRRPYNPKGIYIGMLEQEYQALKLNAQNYRSFMLDIGGQSQGVPDYEYEKVSESLIADYWTIDGVAYILDVTDTDASIKQLWKGTQPEASQLGWYTIPIRERYNSQYVFVKQS